MITPPAFQSTLNSIVSYRTVLRVLDYDIQTFYVFIVSVRFSIFTADVLLHP